MNTVMIYTQENTVQCNCIIHHNGTGNKLSTIHNKMQYNILTLNIVQQALSKKYIFENLIRWLTFTEESFFMFQSDIYADHYLLGIHRYCMCDCGVAVVLLYCIVLYCIVLYFIDTIFITRHFSRLLRI